MTTMGPEPPEEVFRAAVTRCYHNVKRLTDYLADAGYPMTRERVKELLRALPPVRPAGRPTQAVPGTAAKVEVLRRRVALGQELWHDGDFVEPVVCRSERFVEYRTRRSRGFQKARR
jgi:hypothetical protein